MKSFDRIIGEPGAVLDGRGIATRGLYGFGGETGQKEVVVRGLVIRNVAGQAIKAGWNWLIEDNEVLTSTVGVALNQGVVVRRNRIHHNAQYGIFGGPTSNVLIVGTSSITTTPRTRAEEPARRTPVGRRSSARRPAPTAS